MFMTSHNRVFDNRLKKPENGYFITVSKVGIKMVHTQKKLHHYSTIDKRVLSK